MMKLAANGIKTVRAAILSEPRIDLDQIPPSLLKFFRVHSIDDLFAKCTDPLFCIDTVDFKTRIFPHQNVCPIDQHIYLFVTKQRYNEWHHIENVKHKKKDPCDYSVPPERAIPVLQIAFTAICKLFT
jgi:hypothetical protein